MGAIYLVIAVIVLVFLWGVFIYNSLISKKNQVKNIRAGVFVQLKKRYDLIPNLVSTVKQYMTHEKEVLEKITELRSRAIKSENPAETFDLNNQLSKLLGSINVAIEAYPDLKANENVLHLQATLSEVEEQISASRRAYNSSVMIYNNAIEMFPSSIVANKFNFHKDDFFQIEESEKEIQNVSKLFEQ